MKIKSIVRDKHVKERFYVRFESGISFPVSAETVAKHVLGAGVELDGDRLDEILKEDEKKRALEASFNLLSFSPRSRKELAERLKLKAFSQSAANAALERLSELNYLNDAAYAKNLLAARRSQGKGGDLIKFEMKRKGITPETIREVFAQNPLSSREEAEALLPLARKRLSLMRGIPKEAAARRLMGFLSRRGFSLETVKAVLTMLKDAPDKE